MIYSQLRIHVTYNKYIICWLIQIKGEMCCTDVGFGFLLFSKQKLSPGNIYHMLVAPCFDKKLEAVREEFYNSLLEARDVDCVLTSGLFCFHMCCYNYMYKSTNRFSMLYLNNIVSLGLLLLQDIVSLRTTINHKYMRQVNFVPLAGQLAIVAPGMKSIRSPAPLDLVCYFSVVKIFTVLQERYTA